MAPCSRFPGPEPFCASPQSPPSAIAETQRGHGLGHAVPPFSARGEQERCMPGSVVPLPPLLSFLELGVRCAGRGGGGLPWSQRLANRPTANSPGSEGEGALTRVGTMGAGLEQVLPAVQDGEILTRIACAPCIHCFSSRRPIAQLLVCVACAKQRTQGALLV